jgi:hypothetical protein
MSNTGTRIAVLSFALAIFVTLAPAQETNIIISVAGTPALVLKMPQAADVTVEGAHTVIRTTETTFHLWSLTNRTTDEVLPRITEIIKGEFVNYKPSVTNDIVIAGRPARHISGKGNEADDGDPGAADVVLFTTGKHVFAACAHGEFDDAVRRSKHMMVALKSAETP